MPQQADYDFSTPAAPPIPASDLFEQRQIKTKPQPAPPAPKPTPSPELPMPRYAMAQGMKPLRDPTQPILDIGGVVTRGGEKAKAEHPDMSDTRRMLIDMGEAGAEVAGSLTSPANLVLMASGIGEGSTLIRALMNVGFKASMAWSAADNLWKAHKAWKAYKTSGDKSKLDEAVKDWTASGINSLFLGAGGREKEPVKPQPSGSIVSEVAREGQKRLPGGTPPVEVPQPQAATPTPEAPGVPHLPGVVAQPRTLPSQPATQALPPGVIELPAPVVGGPIPVPASTQPQPKALTAGKTGSAALARIDLIPHEDRWYAVDRGTGQVVASGETAAEAARSVGADLHPAAATETEPVSPGSTQVVPEPVESVQPPVRESLALPGLQEAISEQNANRARLTAEQLTQALAAPVLPSMSKATGVMERSSPLFGGTEAVTGQKAMFEGAPAPEQPAPVEPPATIMDPQDIVVDPERMQWRERTGRAGTEAYHPLKSVKKWNTTVAAANPIVVWKDPETGKVLVVDGHHRIELAKRLNVPSVEVRFLPAETATQARAMGALINLAHGNARAFDVAQFLRDSGMKPEELESFGVSIKGGVVEDGVALAGLSEPIWNEVVRGDLSLPKVIAIGKSVADHAQQEALLKLTKRGKGKNLSPAEIEQLARFVKSAPVSYDEDEGLFGKTVIEQSLAIEKAKLADWIDRRLAQDKTLFGRVAKGSSRLSEVPGQVIKAEESAERSGMAAQAQQIFDRLSATVGPIGEALNQAAKDLKEGKSESHLKEKLYETVLAAVSETLGTR